MLTLILSNGERIETSEVLGERELLGGVIVGYILTVAEQPKE